MIEKIIVSDKHQYNQDNSKNTRLKKGASTQTVTMRSKIGWIAFSLIALLIYGILRYRTTGDVGFFELNRTCIIMLLLWLAWPELEALPRWLLFLVPICVGVCAWRPQYIVVILPIAFLYLLLRRPAKQHAKEKNKR